MTTPLFAQADILPNSPTAYAWFNQFQRLNEALAWRRTLVSLVVATPPGSPTEGDVYYVPASPTGAWVGQTGKLAVYVSAGWIFVQLYTGMQFWNLATSAFVRWNGSAWV